MLGIGSGSFDPETLVILETAFDEAWITLKTNGSGNIRPAELARRICHLAMEGELIWIRRPVWLLSLIDHFHLHHSADLRRLRAGSSGHLLPPSPPAAKATARQDQAGKSWFGTEEESVSRPLSGSPSVLIEFNLSMPEPRKNGARRLS
jgi:hypothetical protein